MSSTGTLEIVAAPIPPQQNLADGGAPRRMRHRATIALVVLAAALVLLAHPGHLTGESNGADAVSPRQAAKIENWLASRDARIDPGLLSELARSILEEAVRNSLDPILLLAVIQVESGFDPQAVSSRGAQGLMQVKPVVVRALIDQGRIRSWHRNLKDPLVNVRVGASYLAYLNEMFGNLELALTAYNWGPTRIREKIRTNQKLPTAYATRVLSVHRQLEQQLARLVPGQQEAESNSISAAG